MIVLLAFGYRRSKQGGNVLQQMQAGPVYPSLQRLVDGLWTFSNIGGPIAKTPMRFHPDGHIGGYTHYNERRWKIDEDFLALLCESGEISTRFDTAELQPNGNFILEGDFLLDRGSHLRLRLQERIWQERPEFSGKTRLRLIDKITAAGWTVGDHSYGLPQVYAMGPERLHIGKYTSIGERVTVILANHRPDFASTYPFALLREFWVSAPPHVNDHKGKGDVIIGNDVWIGHGALIAAGIRIGNGAIIGSQAVVTRDVPHYGIAVGNPARIVKSRFDDTTIASLLKIAWWNWPDHKVDRYLHLILSDDVQAFIHEALSEASDQDDI